ncbi:MAG: prepilin-type N-terminal cleavage/methylation domain-containing protein [Patescibacteria group bacterium]
MIKQSGFSLLELIIVIVILTILAGIALWTIGSFQKTTQLETAEILVVEVLETAKSKTLSSVQRTNYGVYFEENRLILFSGLEYEEGKENNRQYLLPAGLVLNADFNGQSQVIFKRLTGRPLAVGEVVLWSATNPDKKRIISVSAAGQIRTMTDS